MSYKLICIDIDGTLINSKYEISPRTKTAIQRAQSQGYIVTLVTGRRYLATVSYASQLGMDLPIICFNGGLVVDSKTGKPFHMETISRESALQVFSAWTKINAPVFAYRHSLNPPDIYTQNPGKHPGIQSYLEREGESISIVPSLRQSFLWEPLRIMTYGDKVSTDQCYHDNLALYKRAPLRTLRTTFKGGSHLEVYPEQATKANGLRWLGKYYQLSREQIIAFGDHVNDLDMLEWAGLGVAMGNAVPEAKAAANVVTADNDHDGIALILEDII